MKTNTSVAATLAISADKKIDDIKQSFWFRIGIFMLSIAGGIIFARLLHAGFALLPVLGGGATGKVSPLMAVLRMLRSGLGN